MRRGADYLGDLSRDGRTVLVEGVPVDDVTTHPGFAAAARTIASLYDSAADRADLAYEDGGTSYSAKWLIPRTAADLATRTRVHRHWAEGTFGLMGRTPDFVAAILTAFAGRRDVFDRGGSEHGDRVVDFWREAREHDWHVSYAVTPPQVDRSKAAHQQPEPFLFPGIVEERDDGVIIRGAQMIGTSAALADWLFLSSVAPLQPGDEDYAISVAVPVWSPGLRIHPRRPYATRATNTFDQPLTARFDESDSLIVLGDVFVPWERVFVHRNIALVSAQFFDTGAHVLANFQALVRFLVKMEFASGIAINLADAHGLSAIPPVQAQLGADIAAFSSAVGAIVLAAELQPKAHGDLLLPDPSTVYAGVSLQRRWVVDLMRALRELGGGGLIVMASAAGFASDVTADDVSRYYRSASLSARERVRLLRVMWDLVGSEFGGRQLQYEMFYAAAQHVADRHVFRTYDWSVGREHVRRLLANE
jgi:4-hydroxyphenylacetate 3-monooxygenase